MLSLRHWDAVLPDNDSVLVCLLVLKGMITVVKKKSVAFNGNVRMQQWSLTCGLIFNKLDNSEKFCSSGVASLRFFFRRMSDKTGRLC